MRNGIFKAGDLRLVSPSPPEDNPPLRVGEYCKLNSGSPTLLVVDVDGLTVTVGWGGENSVHEKTIPRACVRRSVQ